MKEVKPRQRDATFAPARWICRASPDWTFAGAGPFPNSAVGAIHRAPGGFPSGKKGDVLTVEFTVMGNPCLGLNGGPAFKHSEAFSFQVATDDKAETDRLWNAIIGHGGHDCALLRAVRLRSPPVRRSGRRPRDPVAGPRRADAAGDPPDLRSPEAPRVGNAAGGGRARLKPPGEMIEPNWQTGSCSSTSHASQATPAALSTGADAGG